MHGWEALWAAASQQLPGPEVHRNRGQQANKQERLSPAEPEDTRTSYRFHTANYLGIDKPYLARGPHKPDGSPDLADEDQTGCTGII